jgi:hypothetical protein
LVTIGEVKFCAGIVVDKLVVEEVLAVAALLQPVEMTTMATKKTDRKTEINLFMFPSPVKIQYLLQSRSSKIKKS